MQYKNYTIERIFDSIAIKNNDDKLIMVAPNEEEAKAYIDELDGNKELEQRFEHMIESKDYTQLFGRFCFRLPSHCYISSHLATTDEIMFNKYVKQFEQIFNVNIKTNSIYKSGETFYIATDIIPN